MFEYFDINAYIILPLAHYIKCDASFGSSLAVGSPDV